MGLRVSIEHADGNPDLVGVNHGDIWTFEPLKAWTKNLLAYRGLTEVTSPGRL